MVMKIEVTETKIEHQCRDEERLKYAQRSKPPNFHECARHGESSGSILSINHDPNTSSILLVFYIVGKMSFLTLKYTKKKLKQKTNTRLRVPSSPASRSKRNAGHAASISPQAPGSSPGNDNKQSIRLTMKVAPSKLREVMRATELEALQDTLGGGKVLDAPRSSRRAQQAQLNARASKRSRYAEILESDSDAEGEEDDEEDADAEEDTTMNDFDEIGAEAEGGTDDEDVEMEDEPLPVKKAPITPKPPKITLKTPAKKGQNEMVKPRVVVTPADVGPVQSVEDQEMEDEEDEEGSGLSQNEDETNLNEDDAEGELEDVEDDEDDELADSDDEAPGSGLSLIHI